MYNNIDDLVNIPSGNIIIKKNFTTLTSKLISMLSLINLERSREMLKVNAYYFATSKLNKINEMSFYRGDLSILLS